MIQHALGQGPGEFVYWVLIFEDCAVEVGREMFGVSSISFVIAIISFFFFFSSRFTRAWSTGLQACSSLGTLTRFRGMRGCLAN